MKSSNGTPENNVDEKTLDVREDEKKPLKYPKRVFFIISNEFCERFCYYGNRTILAIYLQSMLGYSEDNATILYHAFVMLCYIFPIMGAILADCYLGKFRTILYLSIVYAIGNIVLSTASNFALPINHTAFSLLGLFLIAVGTGGIKPCVSSFGGDQFVIPGQEKQLASFFSVFYFSINAGSLISTYLTPELRVMSCFGYDSCYPLAFGIPAALMVCALIIFVCGKPLYTQKNPEGNIMVDISKCVVKGIKGKISSKEKKEHWLDYAEEQYGQKLVAESKVFMELIYLFSPTIIFWALYDQQGSRWTFQAEHMNGRIWGFTIMPDQMQAINPILIMLFIPLFDMGVYPLLSKLRLVRSSVEKMFWGGIIAAVAFAMSAYLEYLVQDSYAVTPGAGEAQIRIFNSYNCTLQINATANDKQYNWTVGSVDMAKDLSFPVSGQIDLSYSAAFEGTNCPDLTAVQGGTLTVYEEEAISFITAAQSNGSLSIVRVDDNNFDDLTKSDDSTPKVRIVYTVSSNSSFTLTSSAGSSDSGTFTTASHSTDTFSITADSGYYLIVDGQTVMSNLNLDVGGVYSLLVGQNTNYEGQLFTLTNANTVNMLWQLPQLIVISAAEIMLSITGLEFSYSKAPQSLKSVISSLWLLTDSFGNLIIILVSSATENIAQMYVLGAFTVLMVVVMLVFILLAKRFNRAMKKIGHVP